MVYASKTALLLKEYNQVCLIQLESLTEFYGTAIYVVDKVNGQIYAVKQNTVEKIGLHAYIDEELAELEGSMGFTPMKLLLLKILKHKVRLKV